MVRLKYGIITDYEIIEIKTRFSIDIKTYQNTMLPISCGLDFNMEDIIKNNNFMSKLKSLGLPNDGFDYNDPDLALFSYEISGSKRYYGSFCIKFDKETTEMMKLVLNIFYKKKRFIINKID